MGSGQTVEEKMSEFGFPLPTGDPSVLPPGAKLERVNAITIFNATAGIARASAVIHWARLSLTAYTPETNATAMSRRKKNQEARLL